MNSWTKKWLWGTPTLLCVGGLLLFPLIGLLRLSFMENEGGGSYYVPGTWSLDSWKFLRTDSYFHDICTFTLGLGLGVTTLCLLIGYPLALSICHSSPRLKPALLAALVITKLSNLLVTVYGLKFLLDDFGPINRALSAIGLTDSPLALQHSLAGVVIGKTLIILPYTVLFLWIGLERIDPKLTAAARGLGASGWETFRLVVFPLSLPALRSATLISLIWACGAFISPYLLGSPEQITLAVDVQHQMFGNFNWPRAAAEGIAMITIIGLIAVLVASIAKPRQIKTGA